MGERVVSESCVNGKIFFILYPECRQQCKMNG